MKRIKEIKQPETEAGELETEDVETGGGRIPMGGEICVSFRSERS